MEEPHVELLNVRVVCGLLGNNMTTRRQTPGKRVAPRTICSRTRSVLQSGEPRPRAFRMIMPQSACRPWAQENTGCVTGLTIQPVTALSCIAALALTAAV